MSQKKDYYLFLTANGVSPGGKWVFTRWNKWKETKSGGLMLLMSAGWITIGSKLCAVKETNRSQHRKQHNNQHGQNCF
jgi:hypothetical protein